MELSASETSVQTAGVVYDGLPRELFVLGLINRQSALVNLDLPQCALLTSFGGCFLMSEKMTFLAMPYAETA